MSRSLRCLAAVVAGGIALLAPSTGLAAAAAPTPAARAEWMTLAPGAEPQANPLKGFIPYEEKFTNFPHSMEWSYFPVRAVMKGPHTFDWSATDKALRQMHAYDDFDNHKKSVSPDYEDPKLRAAMKTFVAALGRRYDGDPRIGFVQAGLLGFWGEWHTWPHNGENGLANWFASDQVQTEVLKAYVQAFRHTQLEVRYASATNAWMPIGYHDDSFALETKRSSLGWHFMDIVDANKVSDKWKAYSIGGELRPELQACLFTAAGCKKIEDGGDNDLAGSVEQTHASWLLNQGAFEPGFTGADQVRAIKASQSLGYSFRATKALLPARTPAGTVDVGLAISNTGVAPFYGDWPVKLKVLNAKGTVVRTGRTDWLLSAVASGTTQEFTGHLDLGGLKSGTYRVVAQGDNPMKGGMPVRFANATQDQDRDGWMTIGTTTITRG